MERLLAGGLAELGEREIGVIAATPRLIAQDGLALDIDGIDLSAYRRNPIVHFNHNPDAPVGTTTAIGANGDGDLAARIAFAPAGISQVADEVCALVKAGVVRGVSIGFDVDPKSITPIAGGGRRARKSKLYEISIVTVPADSEALVTARSALLRTPRGRFDRLPRIERAALDRAATSLRRSNGASILPHSWHVWVLQETARQEQIARRKRIREHIENSNALLRDLPAAAGDMRTVRSAPAGGGPGGRAAPYGSGIR